MLSISRPCACVRRRIYMYDLIVRNGKSRSKIKRTSEAGCCDDIPTTYQARKLLWSYAKEVPSKDNDIAKRKSVRNYNTED